MTKTRQRRTTLKDVAEAAGVTQATVSLALNNKGKLPAARTRQIQRIAEKLNYRPSVFGRALQSGRTSSIGVVVNYFSNFFFQGVFLGIEEVLENRNYNFLASQAHDMRERERTVALRMADQGVEGLIVHPCSNKNDHLQKISEDFGLPVVLIAHAFPGFMSVVSDDQSGTLQGMEHLLSLKRPKILHIAGPQERTAVRIRCEVFADVMSRRDPEFDPKKDICYANALTPECGYEAMRTLLRRHKPPFALLAGNDTSAFGAAHFCRENGVRIPEDVALLSFGGTAFIDRLGLDLSSVNIPFADIGRTAAQTILDSLADPEHRSAPKIITLPMSLTVRGSTSI